MDRSMIDATSGGALMDKIPTATRHLISNMAGNTQQFRVRGLSPSRLVSEIGAASNQRLENQLTELTSLCRRQPFRPGLSQGPYVAQRFGSVPNVPQLPAGYQQPTPQYQASPFQQQKQQRLPPQGNSPSLEDLLKQLATSNLEFQQSELQQHAVLAKYDRHHPRPQDADRTVSQHCKPITVGRVHQPSFSNNSESEREHKCSYVEKWKRTISTSTAIAMTNRSRF
ncbi:hypothetical protein CR513_32799, partial [Mucuna pruriens]